MELIGADGLDRFEGITNEQLVARVLAGESALLEVLVRRHNQRIFRIVRSITKDDAEAEDVMQEAYTRAYAKLSQFEGRASFSTWLTKIAIHEAIASARRRGRMVDLHSADDSVEQVTRDTSSASRDPEDLTGLRELGQVLERSLEELPDSQRIVVTMRDVEGMSTAETAQCLGVSAEAIKVRLHRARSTLRTSIDERISEATRNAFLFLVPRCDAMVRRVYTALSLP